MYQSEVVAVVVVGGTISLLVIANIVVVIILYSEERDQAFSCRGRKDGRRERKLTEKDGDDLFDSIEKKDYQPDRHHHRRAHQKTDSDDEGTNIHDTRRQQDTLPQHTNHHLHPTPSDTQEDNGDKTHLEMHHVLHQVTPHPNALSKNNRHQNPHSSTTTHIQSTDLDHRETLKTTSSPTVPKHQKRNQTRNAENSQINSSTDFYSCNKNTQSFRDKKNSKTRSLRDLEVEPAWPVKLVTFNYNQIQGTEPEENYADTDRGQIHRPARSFGIRDLDSGLSRSDYTMSSFKEESGLVHESKSSTSTNVLYDTHNSKHQQPETKSSQNVSTEISLRREDIREEVSEDEDIRVKTAGTGGKTYQNNTDDMMVPINIGGVIHLGEELGLPVKTSPGKQIHSHKSDIVIPSVEDGRGGNAPCGHTTSDLTPTQMITQSDERSSKNKEIDELRTHPFPAMNPFDDRVDERIDSYDDTVTNLTQSKQYRRREDMKLQHQLLSPLPTSRDPLQTNMVPVAPVKEVTNQNEHHVDVVTLEDDDEEADGDERDERVIDDYQNIEDSGQIGDGFQINVSDYGVGFIPTQTQTRSVDQSRSSGVEPSNLKSKTQTQHSHSRRNERHIIRAIAIHNPTKLDTTDSGSPEDRGSVTPAKEKALVLQAPIKNSKGTNKDFTLKNVHSDNSTRTFIDMLDNSVPHSNIHQSYEHSQRLLNRPETMTEVEDKAVKSRINGSVSENNIVIISNRKQEPKYPRYFLHQVDAIDANVSYTSVPSISNDESRFLNAYEHQNNVSEDITHIANSSARFNLHNNPGYSSIQSKRRFPHHTKRNPSSSNNTNIIRLSTAGTTTFLHTNARITTNSKPFNQASDSIYTGRPLGHRNPPLYTLSEEDLKSYHDTSIPTIDELVRHDMEEKRKRNNLFFSSDNQISNLYTFSTFSNKPANNLAKSSSLYTAPNTSKAKSKLKTSTKKQKHDILGFHRNTSKDTINTNNGLIDFHTGVSDRYHSISLHRGSLLGVKQLQSTENASHHHEFDNTMPHQQEIIYKQKAFFTTNDETNSAEQNRNNQQHGNWTLNFNQTPRSTLSHTDIESVSSFALSDFDFGESDVDDVKFDVTTNGHKSDDVMRQDDKIKDVQL